MKKISILLFLLSLTSVTMAQNSDFYVGKWEMEFIGTPQGDAKMYLIFSKDGPELKGEITSPDGQVIEVTKIEEAADGITLYFTIQSYDVNVAFTKEDNDHLKGSLMGMFDAKATRASASGDYFAGKWKMTVYDTPNGDASLTATFTRDNGTLNATLSAEDGTTFPVSGVEEETNSVKVSFAAMGYDVWVLLSKKDADKMEGSSMDMFKADAVRIK